ncbi:MAG TPA: hydrolase [Massilia sp.]|nr:hydrolase [Massilia sp.]
MLGSPFFRPDAALKPELKPDLNPDPQPATTPARRPWPRAVLFDLDDTLWPIAPVILQAEQTLFAWLSSNAPRVAQRFTIDSLRQARLELLASRPEFQLDLGALRRAGLLAAFEQAGEDTAKVELAMVEFFAARNAVTPYDDVLPGLLRLKSRVLLGSVTNGNADLQIIGLAHHFQASVSAPQFGRAKPDPAIFHAACAALGVAPQEAVYVGDDLILDVQGAQRAGLRGVWMNRTASRRHLEEGVQPDAIVANFDELLAWLRHEFG